MKKKALALAVAGALGAPALALAQTSTVQIYGQANVHLSKTDQGEGLRSVDGFHLQDSYLGFRGEEKVGGGLSAWFQCESTFGVTGEGNEGNGFCTRNSGVGLKGGFGNVFFGVWDTPYKIIHGSVYRPFSTTGPYGHVTLLHNGSVGHGANGMLGSPNASSGTADQAAGFSRRQVNTINYHSASYGGFSFMGAISTADEATSLTNAAAPSSKPRLISMGASYTAGPMYLGLGYETHKAYNPGLQPFGFGGAVAATAGTNVPPAQPVAPTAAIPAGYQGNGEDRALELIGAYTFGPVRLGAGYTRLKYEVAGPVIAGELRDVKVKGWALFGDWRIAGPHSLRLGYIQAQDVKGNGTVNVNNLTAPLTAAGVAVPDTGAKLYLIQYAYAFSKRTVVGLGYAKLDNERNSRHRMQSLAARNTCQGAAPPPAGTIGTVCDRGQDAWVVSVTHRF